MEATVHNNQLIIIVSLLPILSDININKNKPVRQPKKLIDSPISIRYLNNLLF
jgi:hypothetical protein